jgi:hypothetical protein
MKRAIAIAATALCVTHSVGATPCEPAKLARGAPLRLSYGPGGLGTVPEACGADEAALVADGTALVAVEDFYGLLSASVALRGRWRFDERTWVSLQIPGLDFRYSANATVDVSSLDVGAGALGLHRSILEGPRVSVAPYVRVLIPTETVYQRARRWGFDQGLSAVWRPSSKVELSGGTGIPYYDVVDGSHALASLLPTATADLALMPWPAFAGVLGAAVRLRSGRDGGFESFDPRAGVRLHVTGHLEIELAAAFPVGGRDRTDVIAGLYVGWVDATRRISP